MRSLLRYPYVRFPAILLGLAALPPALPVAAQVCANANVFTQEDADTFACTQVTGDLSIVRSTTLTNVDGLSALTSVGGQLKIESNEALTNLNGLSALTSVGGGIRIVENAALTNVDGLSALTTVGWDFYIMLNDALTNVDGLSALTSVEGDLRFSENPALTSIAGLSALTSTKGMTFRENAALTDLNGLSALTSVEGSLVIAKHASLTNLDGLSALTVVNVLQIQENAALTNVNGLSALTSIGRSLLIYDNDALTNVDGLSALTSVGEPGGELGVRIIRNDALTNVDGLSALTSIHGRLWIEENTALSMCNCGLFNLINNGGVTGTITIQNNAPGCNTQAEIVQSGGCSSITIITPTANELVIREPGRAYEITWIAPAVDSVNIFLAADTPGGGTPAYTAVTAGHPADEPYFWLVPDGLLCRSCRLRIVDADDATDSAVSPAFRVKGYELTRVTADDTYERFDPVEHGWTSSNTRGNIWPLSWWSNRFDYADGVDAVTLEPYPEHWGTFALPGDFPDWPLVVQTYGQDQTYFTRFDGALTYRSRAEAHWFNRKRVWGGSCLGFSVSSLLAFAHLEAFAQAYSALPGFVNISDLGPVTADSRLVINELQQHQRDVARLALANARRRLPPTETLAAIKAMLTDETVSPTWLYITNIDGEGRSGAHAVVPYRTAPHPNDPTTEYVYVYDPNAPGNTTLRIVVETGNDRWSYEPRRWSGDRGFYIMDPAETYLTRPAMPELGQSFVTEPGKRSAAGVVQFYTPTEGHVRITASDGSETGYADSLTFGDIAGGGPIIPPVGGFSPPVGYYLPADDYAVEFSAFSEDAVRLSALVDSVIYTYQRTGATFDQRDQIGFDGGLGIRNPDEATKRIRLQAIAAAPTWERRYDVSDLDQAGGDSLRIGLDDAGVLDLVNAGRATSYRLSVRELGDENVGQFERENVLLEGGAVHRVRPTPTVPEISFEILIDAGGDGVYDDTLQVGAVTTDIESAEEAAPPERYGLLPNYPNPFRATTEIAYALRAAAAVRLEVYDALGRRVAVLLDGFEAAGRHRARFDATNLPGGVYLVRLEVEGTVQTRPIILAR